MRMLAVHGVIFATGFGAGTYLAWSGLDCALEAEERSWAARTSGEVLLLSTFLRNADWAATVRSLRHIDALMNVPSTRSVIGLVGTSAPRFLTPQLLTHMCGVFLQTKAHLAEFEAKWKGEIDKAEAELVALVDRVKRDAAKGAADQRS